MINKYTFLVLILLQAISGKGHCQSNTEIAKKSISSTVSIISLDSKMQPMGFGSGFVIAPNTIATNVHVIEGSSNVYVLINNNTTKFKVNGYSAIDIINDIIILKTVEIPSISGIIQLGNNEIPDIGEKIFAVGNPKGLSGTFSEGIVSGIRDLQNRQVLQITAPISPGSSGGPILNQDGFVIGIAFGGYSDGQNLNFAVPVKYLNSLILKQSGMQQINTVKPQVKPKSIINGNIKDGVQIRNIEAKYEQYSDYYTLVFSIKNNLEYNVSNVHILLLALDFNNEIVDSFEGVFFRKTIDHNGINPYLARSFNGNGGVVHKILLDGGNSGHNPHEHWYENMQQPNDMLIKKGYKIIGRVLDFQINE